MEVPKKPLPTLIQRSRGWHIEIPVLRIGGGTAQEAWFMTTLERRQVSRLMNKLPDPLDAFLQTRPFPGSLPRRAGFWRFTDRQQQQVLRVDTQPMAQAPPQRHVERTHHQIESALHARVQGFHALVHDIEQTVDYMPHDVQGALLTPLTPSCVASCTSPGYFPSCTRRQMTMTNRRRGHSLFDMLLKKEHLVLSLWYTVSVICLRRNPSPFCACSRFPEVASRRNVLAHSWSLHHAYRSGVSLS